MTMPSLTPVSIRENVKTIIEFFGLFDGMFADVIQINPEMVGKVIEFAVTAERESCAHIAEQHSPAAAAAIRRSDQ